MILIYVSCLIALLLTLILGVPYISHLKQKTYSQYIREEGPESHSIKSGTPTMGGIMIVIPSILSAILALAMAQRITTESLIALLVFALFMLAGFKDDYKKVTKKQNKGLSARGKLLLQFFIALIPSLYVGLAGDSAITFFGHSLELGYIYPFFAMFIIVGSSNAVNLTDGLDGLATSTSIIALIATSYVLVSNGRYDLAIVAAAVIGSSIGFLYFNKYPAKVFMGDTGSLALGGILGTIAVLGKFELLLAIIGMIFVVETLSVIIQVTSFKTTGKRVFKMSPIHHHFELCGWHEIKIVYMFCGICALFGIVAVILNNIGM